MNRLQLPPPIADAFRESPWRVLVTGASGWLGQATLELLANTLGDGWHRRVVAFGSQPRQWTLRDGIVVQQQALAELPGLPVVPSLLLHFAYLTREKASAMSADAYTATNRTLSELAANGGARVGVERVFVTSSGAIHAALMAPDDPSPALLYGKLKLEDETRFRSFAAAAPQRRAIVARLFNLSGPYINKLDSYALSSFIQQARSGHISIRANHPVIRSYTSVHNLLSVAFGELLANDADTFNCFETEGDQTVEMAELADAVRQVVNPAARISRGGIDDYPVDRYVGAGQTYRQLLAQHGIEAHSLARQIADTADYLASPETPSS